MKKESQVYYFYLEPYVYSNSTKSGYILYNTLNKRSITGTSIEITDLIEKLNKPENSYVIEIDIKSLTFEIENFIKKNREFFMGDYLPVKSTKNKPVQIIPTYRFRNTDLTSINKINIKETDKDELRTFVKEITFYINTSIDNEKLIAEISGQTEKSFNGKNNEAELSVSTVNYILSELYADSYNIFGDNIFLHSEFQELVNSLNQRLILKIYHFSANYVSKKDFFDGIESCEFNNTCFYIHLITTITIENLAYCKKILEKQNIKSNYIFYIKNRKEYEKYLIFIKKLNIKNYLIKPYYNGVNYDFIKSVSAIDTKEILEQQLTMTDIFQRQELNSNDFGKLIIFPNKDVYSNIYSKPAGNLNNKSIFELIYEIVDTKQGWFLTRNKFEPCKSCLFCNLCPPVSYFEKSLKQNYICNVYEN